MWGVLENTPPIVGSTYTIVGNTTYFLSQKVDMSIQSSRTTSLEALLGDNLDLGTLGAFSLPSETMKFTFILPSIKL